jgi:isoquinoline 1-oxidoreductase
MKPDKIDNYYFKDVNTPPVKFDRRDFIKKLGGGIIIVFSLSKMAFASGLKGSNQDDFPEFNAYLRVREDGKVDLLTGKIEMGQGINTSLAQELADELEVKFENVNVIMGDTDLVPYDAGTWGSMTTRFHGPIIRAAAAEARMVLIELASEKLEIPVSRLEASEGKVFAKNNRSESVSYEELTNGKKIVRSLDEKPELKKPSEFDYIGKSFLRTDAREKVTGKARYAADIQLPGMLYARIARPPEHGSTLISSDTSKAEAMDGVTVLKEDDFIVALHAYPEKAEQAVNAIETRWKTSAPKADKDTIFDHILKNATNSKVEHSGGNLETGKEEAEIHFEEEFHDGYTAHASIETHTATCVFEDGILTMWASSQTPFGTRQQISEALDLPIEKVHLKQIYLGGGFGGKIYNQQAVEAARIAQKVEGTPVQLMWTRKEEFMYDMFSSAAVVKINSGMKNDGTMTYLDFNAYCSGARGTDPFYGAPNYKTTTYNGNSIHPFGTGAWRAPGNPTNTFSRESHIDIMAHKIGMDPLEFRRKNISSNRALRSVNVAAEKFDWDAALPEGHGKGMAVGYDAGTFVTIMVEVDVNKSTGEVKVLRAVVGQDMGQVVNPAGADIQAEGCVNMGLGYSLTEEVDFNWGKINNENFGDYQLPLFSMIPEKIDSVYVDAMDEPPQGGGEPAIISMGGAIANAVFDACGARVRRMPLTPKRVLEALNKGTQ